MCEMIMEWKLFIKSVFFLSDVKKSHLMTLWFIDIFTHLQKVICVQIYSIGFRYVEQRKKEGKAEIVKNSHPTFVLNAWHAKLNTKPSMRSLKMCNFIKSDIDDMSQTPIWARQSRNHDV